MGDRDFLIPTFQRPALLDVPNWAKANRYMPNTAAMFSYEQSPYLELPSHYMSDLAETSMVVIKTPAQVGKDLAWYTPIPTPTGFVTMEDLREGDYVYSMDGTPTRVSFKTPPQYNPMYRVHFDDGTHLDAGKDHRWLASCIDGGMRRKPERVYTTQDMVDFIECKRPVKAYWSRGKMRSIFAIRMPDPVQNPDANLPIDPYTLGFWLGDGNNCGGGVSKPRKDLEELFPQYAHLIHNDRGKCERLTFPGLTHKLRLNNLLHNKHIPEIYFNASVEQRLALLQGLMDTDGTFPNRENAVGDWCQKSERLTKDFLRLLNSLGIKASCHKRIKKIKSLNFEGEYYFVHFTTDLPIFRLKRKSDRMGRAVRNDSHWRYIRSIEPIPTVRSYCIAVEHPSHTYLAGEQYCVTHNTTAIENALGWIVTYCPATTMLILDSLKSGMKMSQSRIRPWLRTCGVNNPNNTRSKNPDKSNSVINIGIGKGANLYVCSAKSVSDLRSTPARFIFMDEVDAWSETVEGDPIELALARSLRFRFLHVMTSTPTTPDGNITKYFLTGTQQTFGVKCTCGVFMNVLYKDIDFTGSTPVYVCKSCGQVFSEEDIKALEHCYSDPQNADPYRDTYSRVRRSFEVTAPLCHAFYTWEGLKRAEITALSLGEASYRSFVNTTLGEAYVPKEECEVQLTDLMRLSQGHYDHDSLPTDIAFIVVGADTHDTCLYVNTMGFSADLKRLYGIRYDILVGDPNEKEVWESFYSLFNTVYIRRDGIELMPGFAFCDSGGHRTNAVYMQEFKNKRFLPIKGYVSNKVNVADPLLGKLQKFNLNAGVKGKALVQMLGVNAGKDALNNLEVLTVAGEQHLFFPKGYGYDAEFFKGLLAEKRIDGKWIAPRGSKTANEPTDTTVYAYACAHYYYQKYWATGKDKEALESLKVVQESVKMAENEKIKPEIKSDEPKKPRGRKKKADEVENVSIEKNADTDSHPADNSSNSGHLSPEKPPVKKFRHL